MCSHCVQCRAPNLVLRYTFLLTIQTISKQRITHGTICIKLHTNPRLQYEGQRADIGEGAKTLYFIRRIY